MTKTEIANTRKSHPRALELRTLADTLLTASQDAGTPRWAHLKAVKADQRYWQYLHGAGCQCWSCKG